MANERSGRALDFYGSLCLFPVLVGFGYYSLSRVLKVDKLDPLWRRVIILCASAMLFYNVCCGVYGYTALFMLEKDSKSDSFGMVLCRVSSAGLNWSLGWLYSCFLWFYFHRLQIAFAQASDALRISKRTTIVTYSLILLCAITTPPLAVWVGVDATKPWSPGWGYSCQFRTLNSLWLNLWRLWSMLWVLLSLFISCLYIIKLRRVLIPTKAGERTSVSVESQNAKIERVLKKSAMITILSCLTTMVLSIVPATWFYWTLDGFLNCVLIFCNFEAGNPLFNAIFYPFLVDGCCWTVSLGDGSEQDRIAPQHSPHAMTVA